MTDYEVIALAAGEGFELTERPVGEKWCWGFVREHHERYPAFGERRQAISCMSDWLRRGRAFAHQRQSGQYVVAGVRPF